MHAASPTLLPPELVLQILQHLSHVSTFDADEYKACRLTLLACSLLSKQWHDVVSTELCRNVRIIDETRDSSRLNRFVKQVLIGESDVCDRKLVVRELVLGATSHCHNTADAIRVVHGLGSLPGLRVVDLRGFRLEWWRLLETYPSLRRVTLMDCTLDAGPGSTRGSTAYTVDELAIARCDILPQHESQWLIDPNTFPRLRRLSITGPISLSNESFLSAFATIVCRLTHLSLSFEPRWEPTGPSATQLNLWITQLLPRCRRLTSLRLSLVTINPWIALTLRAVTLARQHQHQDTQLRELEIVLQPEKEHQPVRDMALCFSRLVVVELKSGALPLLERFKVVDVDGKDLSEVMVTRFLIAELEQRGIVLERETRSEWQTTWLAA
ncbi:hypothetical protein ACM66B_004221 [Microbotryomycetes sp. NB124-2]